ncbi:Gfo/Idh/MocA family oxidoreductase [Neobacillus cucumis]|uniref:Gfo/Idh/MocA family protein n=1 Tax=Neobacillus cucumis TaxID=1740721 RepID=UPI002E1F55FC|nr:Gfo/Idh/MocA family oxidoreductase [Neobacillus cucumis]
MEKVKIGIIGTGYTIGIAQQHVEAYQANERAELVALFDIIPGRAAEWASKRGLQDIKICESLQELFDHVDAVSICTPNDTHIDLIIETMKAGKHVICEKPYAVSYEEGKRAVEFAKNHPELVALIGFNYREIPAVKLMKKYIDEGKLGQVFTCRQELGGPRIANPTGVLLEWRMQEKHSGTGALADFGCHMLDLADYLLSGTQGKITEVSSLLETFIKERTVIGEDRKDKVTNDDAAVFNAKMESGTLLSCVSSRIGVPRQMMEIVGEGGMMVFDTFNPNQLKVLFKEKEGGYQSFAFENIEIPEELKGEEGHKGLVNEFISAILDGKPAARDLERGLYIQYVIDMLKKSADEGQVITL